MNTYEYDEEASTQYSARERLQKIECFVRKLRIIRL